MNSSGTIYSVDDDVPDKGVSNSCSLNFENMADPKIDHRAQRYPCCIVWTPIPLITWIFPFIGHMGIGTTVGIIRDFAGSYYVSADNMAFGKPTRYLQLNSALARGGREGWDRAVWDASEEYKGRPHNLILDNCHSHVGMALNQMHYKESTHWNMVNLCFLMFFKGRYVGLLAFIKSWLPFCVLVTIITVISSLT